MEKVFRFSILSDSNWEVKIDKGLDSFSGILGHFELKKYGEDLNGIVLVVMCRDPKLAFKQRKRFTKGKKFLYLDIILDYKSMLQTSDALEKGKIIFTKINNELFQTLEKYKFKDLDLIKLKSDFASFGKKNGLLK